MIKKPHYNSVVFLCFIYRNKKKWLNLNLVQMTAKRFLLVKRKLEKQKNLLINMIKKKETTGGRVDKEKRLLITAFSLCKIRFCNF